MELYQRVPERYPLCVEAVTKWALCWECVGMPKRAEKVLYDALHVYQERGWEDQTKAVQQEIASMNGRRRPRPPATAQKRAAEGRRRRTPI